MQPFLKLNWNIDSPVRSDFKLPIPRDVNSKFMWDYKFHDYVNPKLDIILKETMTMVANNHPSVKVLINNKFNEIIFDKMHVFYTPPDAVKNIHIDGSGNEKFERWAINYVLPHGLNETMSWFVVEPGQSGTTALTPADTLYVSYTPEQLTKIAESSIDNLCLVNIGIPHAVSNNDTRPRYSISLRSKFLETVFSYQEMYNYISEIQN